MMFNNMFKKIFGKSKKSESFIIVELNDKIMPVDRAEYYEYLLHDFLQRNGIGEVTGGGTMMEHSGEIKFCDIEILLYENDDIQGICGMLTEVLELYGAPKGSNLTIQSTDDQITFGKREGLAIYLDGVNLPEHVYAECDVNVLRTEICKLIGSAEEPIERIWQGETETALYFYGDSFIEMKKAISEFINTYPLCQNARITQIA